MAAADTLSEHAVHIWFILAPKELGSGDTARHMTLLPAAEQARYRRFAQAKDRCQYLLGKVLTRTVLSRYLELAPGACIFTTNRYGKPVLANSPTEPAPRFNLAHTEGLVVCAVARDFEVGIDVEALGRTVNLDIARRFFAPAEVAHLERLPETERPRAFLLIWTLKEAYIKARGIGLSLPLEQFAFSLQYPRAPTIVFEPAMHDDPSQWHFLLPEIPSAAHQVAVAAQCGRSEPPAMVIRELDL